MRGAHGNAYITAAQADFPPARRATMPRFIPPLVEAPMTRFSADQLAYAAGKIGYLDRQASLDFLTTMQIRMSVGHWSAGDFCDRFAPPCYHSDYPAFQNNFEGQCRRVKAAGVD